MLTDQQEEYVSDVLRPLFEYLEQEVIDSVAERISNSMTYSRTAELAAKQMQKLGYSPARIRKEAMKILNADPEFRKEVAKNTLKHKKEVKNLLREIEKQAQKEVGSLYADMGELSYLDDLSIWKQAGKELTDSSALPQLVQAITDQTNGELKNLTRTTGFKTMAGFESIQDTYRSELDKAMIKICSGTFSKEQVVYDVIHNLSHSGLRSIDYGTGKSMQLDAAVKLAVRTGSHQLAERITDNNIRKTGENLVYVSTHWGARNTGKGIANHAEWQGKVYYIEQGKDYSEEAKRIGQTSIGDLWENTGYSMDSRRASNPLGLLGYNCRHRKYVWFEGISLLPDADPESKAKEINGKMYDYYAMTQKMRYMERNIRNLKREREALNTYATSEDKVREIKATISKKTMEYTDFCEKCKIKPKYNNLRYDGKTSDITKTEAYKEYQRNVKDAIQKKEIAPDVEKGIIKADYMIRKHNPDDDITKETEVVEQTVAAVPQKVRDAMFSTVIDIGKDGASQYDYDNDILYVAKGAEQDAIFHEIGHMVENKLANKDKIELLKKSFTRNVPFGDITEDMFYDAQGNAVEIYLLHNDKFVSEYQGRIYAEDWSEIYDQNWEIRSNLLQEFVSEPFREYMQDPKRLEKEFPEFYEMIKEAVE